MHWYNSANMTCEVIINIVKSCMKHGFNQSSRFGSRQTDPGIKRQIPVQQKKKRKPTLASDCIMYKSFRNIHIYQLIIFSTVSMSLAINLVHGFCR